MMELCHALEELHVELEEIPLEQFRVRDEFPLMQQWASGRADDRVTLPADLETIDLHTIATSQPTLSAAEQRRLRNDFEDSFDIRRPQLISSTEIALLTLTSWDLLVIDRLPGARSRSNKSTEQVLAETTRPFDGFQFFCVVRFTKQQEDISPRNATCDKASMLRCCGR